ncbi:MAG: FISUMP domain-containing protein [Bacteroidetes bacterium]|nr:FISUMP domain-containing protein [Bacteroidota bacterium]
MKKRNIYIFQFLIVGIFILFASSCKKEDDNNGQQNVPVLSTSEVTEISATTASSGGNITNDGGATVKARGVCWSTGDNPTIDDNKTEDGAGAGSFTSIVSDLELNTTYYLRAYATNSAGTGYGSAMSFTTQEGISESNFTDPRDGKVYQTVVLGDQEWMAENLAFVPSSGNYWAYENDDGNVETYGYLYDWQTAQNVCPTGWHLSSDEEWAELTDYLGENAGGKLKATGTIEAGTGLWYDPNKRATNETGFTALPGGFYGSDGTFYAKAINGLWWLAAESSTDFPWYLYINYNGSSVYRSNNDMVNGLSVRCVKD